MPGGQPTKLTPKLQKQIAADLAKGLPMVAVCEAAGITDVTLRNWRKWGLAGKAPYAEFFLVLTRARARGKLVLSRKILSDGQGSRGAAWMLERTAKEFAPRVNIKVEEELESLLDAVERVCEGKDCGCFEAILAAIAARDSGEAPAGDPGGADQPESQRVH